MAFQVAKVVNLFFIAKCLVVFFAVNAWVFIICLLLQLMISMLQVIISSL